MSIDELTDAYEQFEHTCRVCEDTQRVFNPGTATMWARCPVCTEPEPEPNKEVCHVNCLQKNRRANRNRRG